MRQLSIACVILVISITDVCASKIEWERKLGDQSRTYRPSAIAAAPDRSGVIIAGTSSLAGTAGRSPEFWLWRIDKDGRTSGTIELPNIGDAAAIDPLRDYVKDVVVTENGDALVLVETRAEETFLVTVRPDNSIDAPLKLVFPGFGHVHVARAIATPDGILIGGRSGDNAFVATIDRKGSVLWSNTLDRGDTNAITDIIAVENETHVLGRTGIYTPSFIGEYWIAAVKNRGELTIITRFPARDAAITTSGTGFGILADRKLTAGIEVWVEKRQDGQRQWHRLAGSDPQEMAAYPAVTKTLDGSFMTAFAQHFALKVITYSSKGNVLATWTDDAARPQFHAYCRRLVSLRTRTVALTVVYAETESHWPSYKVGVLSFQ